MFIKDWYREVKYFIQRGMRGYSDRDCWNVDYHLATIIPPMLRRLKDGIGYPYGMTPEEHCDVLENVAQGFEAWKYLNNGEYFIIDEHARLEGGKLVGGRHHEDTAAKEEAERKYKEGFDLFVKHFSSFWD